jgi:hypothetical protein
MTAAFAISRSGSSRIDFAGLRFALPWGFFFMTVASNATSQSCRPVCALVRVARLGAYRNFPERRPGSCLGPSATPDEARYKDRALPRAAPEYN